MLSCLDTAGLRTVRVENRQFISCSVPTVFIHYDFIPVFTELILMSFFIIL
jgi:hypothetical protein